MKKLRTISIILNICLIFNIAFVPSIEATEPKNNSIYVDARCAIAMDSKSKCVLYEKNCRNASTYCKYN